MRPSFQRQPVLNEQQTSPLPRLVPSTHCLVRCLRSRRSERPRRRATSQERPFQRAKGSQRQCMSTQLPAAATRRKWGAWDRGCRVLLCNDNCQMQLLKPLSPGPRLSSPLQSRSEQPQASKGGRGQGSGRKSGSCCHLRPSRDAALSQGNQRSEGESACPSLYSCPMQRTSLPAQLLSKMHDQNPAVCPCGGGGPTRT